MSENKKEVMSILNNAINESLTFSTTNTNDLNNDANVFTASNLDTASGSTGTMSCWDYYQRWYYPEVIRESYPIYVRERAEDKGKKAFEVIKLLNDKKFVNLKTVKDFIDLMDVLIEVL